LVFKRRTKNPSKIRKFPDACPASSRWYKSTLSNNLDRGILCKPEEAWSNGSGD